MAFIVETGTGIVDANSYISVEGADDYFVGIGNQPTWFEKATIDRERALMSGTQFVDNQYRFIGTKSSQEQGLQWPRTDAIDKNGFELTEEVPKNIKYATCEAAIRTFNSPLYADTSTKGDLRSEKVDVIELEYFEGTATDNPYTIIDKLLFSSGLAAGNVGSSSNQLNVIRS